MSSENDTFVHKAYEFVQSAISTLEQMEQQAKKQLNLMLDSILSTAWLVVQIMSSGAAFNAVKWVTQEVCGLFEGRIPQYMARNFDELQRLLATASEKLVNIQSTCYWLMDQVTKVCESPHWWNPFTVRRLEASRLRASLDIRDCEQSVNSAHEIIELLQRKTTEQAVKLGLGLAFSAAVTLALGFGASKAIQVGANLRGGLLGCATGGGAVACVVVGKKLSDYKAVWDEVCNKRSQYRQVSTRLESLKEAVERDLKAGVLLTGMPDLERAIIVVLAFLAVFGGVFVANVLVK
ncbi:hypothetical protein ACROYT_G011697 [Oculina patagonica]